MLAYLRDKLIAILSAIVPTRVMTFLFRFLRGRRFQVFDAKVSDKSLEGLLNAMAWGILLFPDWRRRMQGFRGTLVFAARASQDPKREPVQATAEFDGKRMIVRKEAAKSFDVKVTFSEPLELFRFVASRKHDIVEALLKNAVDTQGNLNYVYRFGFLVMEMTRWMRVVV